MGNGYAVVIAALNSHTPGVITIASTMFGSNPSFDSEVLAKAFEVDKKLVEELQQKF